MMRIYTPLGSEGFELCQPVDQDDFETINVLVNGEARQATWKPLAMQLIQSDHGKRLQASDSPWLGEHALIFKQSVIAVLGSTLQEYGELLPLACSAADLFMFNPTRVVDALDEEASTMMRFSSGRIMDITRYAFRADVVEGIDIFKIPNLRVSPTFLSEQIVSLWNEAGQRGLEMSKVWSFE